MSLLNGGKDFSRWVLHGETLYRLFKTPVEMALGRGGNGMGDIAIAECELEIGLSGDYAAAMNHVCAGLARVESDLEMRCAAIGIQSRILSANGGAEEAASMMAKCLDSLPADAPKRLKQNLQVHRLSLLLLKGDTQEAMTWLSEAAPDEHGDFVILDRYAYLLKLRLYIIRKAWAASLLLRSRLESYCELYDRPYLRAQLHLLQAIQCYRRGEDDWTREINAALTIARRYHLARVIADEGAPLLPMLESIAGDKKDEWTQGVLFLTRLQAERYPDYLSSARQRPVFDRREKTVYDLLIAGATNPQIAAAIQRNERTAKLQVTKLFKKMGVSNRTEAIKKAMEWGDI